MAAELRFPPYRNFFDNSTKKNFSKNLRISYYYDRGLNEVRLTNPLAAQIYLITHPEHLAYVIGFNKNRGDAGTVHGKVFTKDGLAVEMNHTYVGDWDYEFQKIHRKGTVQYEKCWIGGHEVITHGPMDERINGVYLLTQAMIEYAELDVLRGVIEAFYVLIMSAEDAVVGKKSVKKGTSGSLEIARISNSDAMFKGFGLMLSVGSTDAEMDAFVDTEEIQQKKTQMLFDNGIIAAHRNKIASRTLTPLSSVEVINNGAVDLKFFVIRFPEDPHGIFVNVPAGQTMTFAASLLGNINNSRYVMVQNDSLTTAGHYSFRFID